MPDYVEHKEGVNQVGKLSAEAVEYDAAVKEIEALGAELTDAANQRKKSLQLPPPDMHVNVG